MYDSKKDLIDTQWNVNYIYDRTPCTCCADLIDTQWNVNGKDGTGDNSKDVI